jgi:hypothetical protein
MAAARWLQTVRLDLGREWFLDPVALASVIPTATIASVASYSQPTVRSVLGWTLANLLAFASCAPLAFALVFTTRSRRRSVPLPITVTLVAGASLGAIKVLATDRASGLLGLMTQGDSTLGGRVVQGVVLGVVVVPVLVLMRATLARHRTEHRLLVAETFARALEPTDPEDVGSDARKEAAEVLGELRVVLSGAEPSRASAMLADAVENRLRPLTHRLWTGAAAPSSDLTVRGLVGAMLRRPVYPVLAPTAVHAVMVTLFALDMTTPGRALAVGGAAAGVLASLLHLARLSRPRGGRATVGFAHLGLTLAAVSTSSTLLLGALLGPVLTLRVTSLVVVMLVWSVPLVLASGIVATAVYDRGAVRSNLIALLDPESYAQFSRAHVDSAAARDVADRLHGDLQGALLAAAARLKGMRSDREAASAELDRIDALLVEALRTPAAAPAVTLATNLADLAARWRGFLDVAWTLDPALSRPLDRGLDPGLGTDGAGATGGVGSRVGAHTEALIVGIVSEALTNAYRHGAARNVRIDVVLDAGTVDLKVEDDGVGLRGGRVGIGSRHLDAVAPGAWSRTALAGGGTRLAVGLRTSADAAAAAVAPAPDFGLDP